jgi:hypothetical protein
MGKDFEEKFGLNSEEMKEVLGGVIENIDDCSVIKRPDDSGSGSCSPMCQTCVVCSSCILSK